MRRIQCHQGISHLSAVLACVFSSQCNFTTLTSTSFVSIMHQALLFCSLCVPCPLSSQISRPLRLCEPSPLRSSCTGVGYSGVQIQGAERLSSSRSACRGDIRGCKTFALSPPSLVRSGMGEYLVLMFGWRTFGTKVRNATTT